MPTKVEKAYCALLSDLQTVATADARLPDAVHRNENTADVFDLSETSAFIYLNLLDDTAEIEADLLGDGEGEVEFRQPATLELLVYNQDSAARHEQFDDAMAALRDYFVEIRGRNNTLGGAVDDVQIRRPPLRNPGNAPTGTLAAVITIDLLLTAETVFG